MLVAILSVATILVIYIWFAFLLIVSPNDITKGKTMEFKQTLSQGFDKQNDKELLEQYSTISLLLGMSNVVGEEPGESPVFVSLQQEIENSPAGTQWEVTFRKLDTPREMKIGDRVFRKSSGEKSTITNIEGDCIELLVDACDGFPATIDESPRDDIEFLTWSNKYL